MDELELQENEAVKDWLSRLNFTYCKECTVPTTYTMNLQPKQVSPRGPLDAPIVIVGEAPGKEEETDGEVFVGPAGRKLKEFLTGVGLDMDQFYITNTMKCRPQDNRQPTTEECKKCREKFLKRELLAYPRKLIIPLGNIGYYGVVPKGTATGIMARNGLFEDNEEFNCQILPCIHPAAILRNPSNDSLMQDVVIKVARFISDGYALAPKKPIVYKHIRDLSMLEEFMAEVKDRKQFSTDIETEGFNFQQDKILCIVFSTQACTAWYLPIIEEEQFVWSKDDWKLIQESLRTIFEDPDVSKIGHNFKFDLKFLIYNFGWQVRGQLDDTMLMHHLLDENTAHGLKSLASRFTDMGSYSKELDDAFKAVKRSHIPIEDKNYGQVDTKILSEYALADADATYRLYEYFCTQIPEGTKLDYLYHRNVMEVTKALVDMEMVGVRVDMLKLQEYKHLFRSRLDELEKEVGVYSPEPINLRSVAQLQNFLYELLKFPVLATTDKGKPSTDEATLKLLKERVIHPVLDLLLDYREVGKLYSTYVIGLESQVDENNRVHTSYLQHGTKTGRLASKEPNLQNIVRPDVTGKIPPIRHLFIPTEGWLFIQSDYAQMELRAWAQYTQEKKFIDALTSSDVHSYIGSILLDKPMDQINKEERNKVKTVIFGVAYGRGAQSVAEGLNISYAEAAAFIDLFFKMFPQSAAWMLEQEKTAIREEKVTNFFGRVRHLPEVKSTDSGVRAAASRQARNSSIQGLAADVTNLALMRVHKAFKQENMKARPLMQIHDAIICESPKDEVKDAYNIMKACMLELPPNFTVPLAVDIEITDRWDGNKIALEEL